MVDLDTLLKIAEEKIDFSYSKYSNIRVVAVLVTGAGKIYFGVNIENASYGLTICAERVAIFKAISEGERKFEAMLIYSPDVIPWPCGACRQVMAEFFSPTTKIIIASKYSGKLYLRELTFNDIFPAEYQFKIQK